MNTDPKYPRSYRHPETSSKRLFGSLILSGICLAIVIYATS
jgi:hypothetical protein